VARARGPSEGKEKAEKTANLGELPLWGDRRRQVPTGGGVAAKQVDGDPPLDRLRRGKEMSLESVERNLVSRTTRRTVVRTGVKIAYAAPVVAATMKVRTLTTSAAQGPNGEFDCDCLPDDHSYHPDTSNGNCVSCNENVTTCPGGSQPDFSGSTIVCKKDGVVQTCTPSIVGACGGVT
jgi:hypothetical protein